MKTRTQIVLAEYGLTTAPPAGAAPQCPLCFEIQLSYPALVRHVGYCALRLSNAVQLGPCDACGRQRDTSTRRHPPKFCSAAGAAARAGAAAAAREAGGDEGGDGDDALENAASAIDQQPDSRESDGAAEGDAAGDDGAAGSSDCGRCFDPAGEGRVPPPQARAQAAGWSVDVLAVLDKVDVAGVLDSLHALDFEPRSDVGRRHARARLRREQAAAAADAALLVRALGGGGAAGAAGGSAAAAAPVAAGAVPAVAAPLMWPSGLPVNPADLRTGLVNLATDAHLTQPQVEKVVDFLKDNFSVPAGFSAPDMRSTLLGLIAANPDGLGMFGMAQRDLFPRLCADTQAFYHSLPGGPAKRAVRTMLNLAHMDSTIKQMVADPAVFNEGCVRLYFAEELNEAGERVYSEITNSDAMRDGEVRCNCGPHNPAPGACTRSLFCLVIFSDGTHLFSLHGQDYYGVFATCGNVDIDVRHLGASAKLVALLPVLDVAVPKHRDAARRRAETELYNVSLEVIAEEVAALHHAGMRLRVPALCLNMGAVGEVPHEFLPIIAMHIADMLEAFKLAGLQLGFANNLACCRFCLLLRTEQWRALTRDQVAALLHRLPDDAIYAVVGGNEGFFASAPPRRALAAVAEEEEADGDGESASEALDDFEAASDAGSDAEAGEVGLSEDDAAVRASLLAKWCMNPQGACAADAADATDGGDDAEDEYDGAASPKAKRRCVDRVSLAAARRKSKPLSLSNSFSGLWHAIYLHLNGAVTSIPPDLLHTLTGIIEALLAGLYDTGASERGGVNSPAFAAFVAEIDRRLSSVVPFASEDMRMKIFSRGIFGLKFLTASEVAMLAQQLPVVLDVDDKVIASADRRAKVHRAFQLVNQLVTVLHKKRKYTSADIASLQQLVSDFQTSAHAAYDGIPYADARKRTQRAKARVGVARGPAAGAGAAAAVPDNFGASPAERWGFPKFHALVHIPEFIRRFGAPRGFNGGTYESLMKVLKELARGAGHGGGGLGHYGNVMIKAAMRSVGTHLLRQTQEARDAGIDVVYAAPGDARRAGLAAAEDTEGDGEGLAAAAAAATTAGTSVVLELWQAYFARASEAQVEVDHATGRAHYVSASSLPAIAAAEAAMAVTRRAGRDLVYLPAAVGAGGIEVCGAFLEQGPTGAGDAAAAAAVHSTIEFKLRQPRVPLPFPLLAAADRSLVDVRAMELVAGLLREVYPQVLMPTALQGSAGLALLTGETLCMHFSLVACHSAVCVRVLQGPPTPPGVAPAVLSTIHRANTSAPFTLYAGSFRGRVATSTVAFTVSDDDARSAAAAPYRADGTWRFGRVAALLRVASRSQHVPAGAPAGLGGPGPVEELAVLQLLQPQSRPAGSGPSGRQPRLARGAAGAGAAVDTRLTSDVFRYTAMPLLPAGMIVVRLAAIFGVAFAQPVMSTLRPVGSAAPLRAGERAFWVRMGGGEAAWALACADWWRFTAPRSCVG